ncbi:hypothetical protein [Streptomyces sp. NPDC059142]|uniref:hypothetical protein n=1 Tax=Streptomyces sp. NPDC059142 TaxID=3346739 RepID=UPI003676AA12
MSSPMSFISDTTTVRRPAKARGRAARCWSFRSPAPSAQQICPASITVTPIARGVTEYFPSHHSGQGVRRAIGGEGRAAS